MLVWLVIWLRLLLFRVFMVVWLVVLVSNVGVRKNGRSEWVGSMMGGFFVVVWEVSLFGVVEVCYGLFVVLF